MTKYEWASFLLAVVAVLFIPTIVILIRGAIKWTRTEDKLSTLIEDFREMMTDKDKMHGEILEQMRVDREATDRRLRFIEEFWMQKGRGA